MAERDSRDRADAAEWLACASRGAFEDAWRISDRIRSRLTRADYHAGPRHLQHVWDGTPIAGRRVLIRCYHGLGDTIQFIRYAALVRSSASSVIAWAQPALMPLLNTVDGIDHLLAIHDGTPAAGYDVDVEVMELPYLFRTTASTIPATVPYMTAERFQPAGRQPHVGIAWRAGGWDPRRSVPFHSVLPLFDCDSVSWWSLQLDCHPDETHPRLACVDVGSVVRTASVMLGMDLIITIDSMAAHLAGALGIPVWTLLPHEPDWRWMIERNDSPWYPTMRLFRQPRRGDWTAVIDAVRASLPQCLGVR